MIKDADLAMRKFKNIIKGRPDTLSLIVPLYFFVIIIYYFVYRFANTY
jgi:hypothetical protein